MKIIFIRDRRHGNIFTVTAPYGMEEEHVIYELNEQRIKKDCDPEPYYEVFKVVGL